MLNKIVIFGVGLIGGSFASALRKAGAVGEIVGVGRSTASLQRAKELGLIDRIATSVEDAMRNADLVLLAAPVAQTHAILSRIQPCLESQTVITDAGSIKGEVIAAAERALGAQIAQFVPGHPIAGRETTGPEAAIADLYVGKKVVLTPLPQNSQEQLARVTQAWQLCGANVHMLSAQEHDAVFAAVSHLPHLLAFALVDECAKRDNADTLFNYAASGFRDFTRIAGSSPEMWRDIALTNQAAILGELDTYLQQITALRAMLAASDGPALEAMFANAQNARHAWLQNIEKAEAQPEQDRDA
ncbi:MAG: prephenate dehydrogenase/arogenate dehydrogenase family protein [Oxalicibacterium faecigallinarum]|uniref:prephenate dehydrogenase n=1 Tax=Oxalicibacterium faecigallinarum TaxID=573741 RepID=UPI0028076D30|nr:prephenate dehydrogenase/arogenate dehydrogenase family protein [Oxalicibacterium faecigallinarum]MDQ7969003.1 prephenate dehydrogenase/arogenate dehydrogenase family protein [Oxalicibacterium faecigallinarum]